MAKKKTTKFRGVANESYIEGMREIRRSNAAGAHLDKRTKRARSRADALRKAVKDSQ